MFLIDYAINETIKIYIGNIMNDKISSWPYPMPNLLKHYATLLS